MRRISGPGCLPGAPLPAPGLNNPDLDNKPLKAVSASCS